MEHQWNETDRGKPTTRRKTCPSATLSTTNPTWTDPGSNPGHRSGRPATNRLSHGTADRADYHELYGATGAWQQTGTVWHYSTGAAGAEWVQTGLGAAGFRCRRLAATSVSSGNACVQDSCGEVTGDASFLETGRGRWGTARPMSFQHLKICGGRSSPYSEVQFSSICRMGLR
jgi:hypothetical protein